MSLELWIAFTLASAALLAVPGPTVLLVVSYALGRGRSSAVATVPGVTLGDFTAMTLSLLGAGAILAASATLFTAMKLLGAAYLFWLGIQLWRAGGGLDALSRMPSKTDGWRMFWQYVMFMCAASSFNFVLLPRLISDHRRSCTRSGRFCSVGRCPARINSMTRTCSGKAGNGILAETICRGRSEHHA